MSHKPFVPSISQHLPLRILSLFFLLFTLHPSLSSAFEGPLQLKNQFPLFIFLNAPLPEKAAPADDLSVSLSYSSVFMVRSSPSWTINLDMELTELAFRYRKNFPGLVELGLTIPFVITGAGFLDGLLDSYHDTFGFPDYGRSERPRNEFLYEVRRNGSLLVKGENGRVGIGDIRVTAKREILKGNPKLSLMADLELPTGNPKKGYGSGSPGFGLALLSDVRASEKISLYLNIGIVFPGDLRSYEKVGLRDYVHGSAAIEYALSGHWEILGQVTVQGSPYPETGISSADRTAVLLSLGGRYTREKNSLEFSFSEDPNTSGATDITFTLLWRKSF